jgi:fucose 4-O-acetylase-like acetyltransferase
MNDKNRNNTIDAIRGFAIILVVIGHILNGFDRNNIVYNILWSIQIPLFVCISGYLSGVKSRTKSNQEGFKLILKRFRMYVIPFFSWILIAEIIIKGNFNIALIIDKILYILNHIYDGGLWFLITIFMIELVTTLSKIIAEKANSTINKNILFYSLSILFVGVLGVQSLLGSSFLEPRLTIYYMPYYLAAHFVGNILKDKSNYALITKIFINGSIPIYCYAICNYELIRLTGILEYGIRYCTGFTGIVIVSYYFSKLTNEKKKMLSFIGRYTLEIYATHYIFLYALKVPTNLNLLLSINGILYLVLAFFIISVCTLIVISLLKKISILNFIAYGKIKHCD